VKMLAYSEEKTGHGKHETLKSPRTRICFSVRL
jgi:hypothetical protein